MMTRRLVGLNEAGKRIGEDHPNARLTDTDVQHVLQLRAEGWTYDAIASVMEISKSTVRDYCLARRRAQVAVRWVEVGGARKRRRSS